MSTRTIDDDELTDDELEQDARPGERAKRDGRGNRRDYTREYQRRKELRRERGETPKTDAKPRKNAGGKRSLEGDLRGFLELGGRVWSIRDPVCGPTLVEQSAAIAKALDLTAQRSDAVYQWLDGLLSTGGGAGLAMALWPVAIRIAEHHVLPAFARRREAMGAPLPITDEEEFEAQRLADEERLNADLSDEELDGALGEATRPP